MTKNFLLSVLFFIRLLSFIEFFVFLPGNNLKSHIELRAVTNSSLGQVMDREGSVPGPGERAVSTENVLVLWSAFSNTWAETLLAGSVQILNSGEPVQSGLDL